MFKNQQKLLYGQKGTAFENVAGRLTGGEYPCRMESCRGSRVGVRWPDGKITYPCSSQIVHEGDHFRLE